jgi:polysaccharide pyruvyl transferase WcaK-like protein
LQSKVLNVRNAKSDAAFTHYAGRLNFDSRTLEATIKTILTEVRNRFDKAAKRSRCLRRCGLLNVASLIHLIARQS